jgi:hypothetical protein
MDKCAVCESTETVDFHHWDYEHDIGVLLCRDCHNYVHGGSGGRVSIQQNRVEYYGGSHWWQSAIRNLIIRDLKTRGLREYGIEPLSRSEVDQAKIDEMWVPYSKKFEERYNLPERWRTIYNAGSEGLPPGPFAVALSQASGKI